MAFNLATAYIQIDTIGVAAAERAINQIQGQLRQFEQAPHPTAQVNPQPHAQPTPQLPPQSSPADDKWNRYKQDVLLPVPQSPEPTPPAPPADNAILTNLLAGQTTPRDPKRRQEQAPPPPKIPDRTTAANPLAAVPVPVTGSPAFATAPPDLDLRDTNALLARIAAAVEKEQPHYTPTY